ncbi:MAG: N-acetyltransferase family protein [Planctomycetota bacterium]
MPSLRLALPSDAAALSAIYRPIVEGTWTSFETEAPSPREMAERAAQALRFAPWIVVEDAGAVTGYAYACRHRERAAYRWAVEVSVYLDAAHRGRGLGRRLYAGLFDLLRLQGFVHAYAGITLPNPASTGFHQAMGFTSIGTYAKVGFKLGAWRDVQWLHLGLVKPPIAPAAPVPLPEMDPDAVERALATPPNL